MYKNILNTNKRLQFEGNSLLNYSINFGVPYNFYIGTQVYANLVSNGYKGAYFDSSISSRTQTQINSLMATNYTDANTNNNRTVLNWEGTNDMGLGGLSSAAAFANLQVFIAHITQYTNKYLICTVIARDHTTDAVDLMDRIDAYNVLVRANYPSSNVCDLAALSMFDTRAKASDTDYYKTDKLHLATAGQAIVITEITNKLLTII